MTQHASYLVGLTIEGLIIVAVVATVVAIVTTRRRERAQARAFHAEQRATGRIVAELPPLEHVGATEDWSPAAETAAADQTPDLRTTGEQMVADHAELAGISNGIDQFSERVMHELRLFCGDDLELFMNLTRWGGHALEDTGTFPVVREPIAAGAR